VSTETLRDLTHRLADRGTSEDRALAAVVHAVENHITILNRRIELAHQVLDGLNEVAAQLYVTEHFEAMEELGLVGEQRRLIRYLEQARDGFQAEVKEKVGRSMAVPA
jgi:hypothetical protein